MTGKNLFTTFKFSGLISNNLFIVRNNIRDFHKLVAISFQRSHSVELTLLEEKEVDRSLDVTSRACGQFDSRVNRRYYELAALWLLRQQLRSGDIYITQSRRFSQLETYFIPSKEWSLYRDEVVNLTGTPIDAKLRLAERSKELITLIGQVEELLNQFS